MLECDIVLVGAGVMSATLATFFRELHPEWDIHVFERLDRIAAESSDAWNNAGTGHSAFCELNYTPRQEDGSIDCRKAYKIADAFELSRQFWAYLVEKGLTDAPGSFINQVPHLSFVEGDENVRFLKKRYDALAQNCLFAGMEYSEDPEVLRNWIPLVMHNRPAGERVAATRMREGVDVDFGHLTRLMFRRLQSDGGIQLHLQHEVRHLEQQPDGRWTIKVRDEVNDTTLLVSAQFVFLGAGGGALDLLDESEIPEGQGYGGFPVSGQWLICRNPALIAQHHAKVYGLAAMGAPPMSVPHLDTRIINGQKALLFGPFAGFTTKFLKEGSVFDLPAPIDLENLTAMLGAWIHNFPLTRYLVSQVLQSQDDRLQELRAFVCDARAEDWELATAGYRVQVIKKDEEEGGVLEFGTELVTSTDHSLVALLGASPGASTSVHIMLELLQRCFPRHFALDAWQDKLREMMPSFGLRLAEHPALTAEMRRRTGRVLALNS